MSETLSAPDPVMLPGTIGLGLPKLTFSFKFAAALFDDLSRLDQWLQEAYQIDTAQSQTASELKAGDLESGARDKAGEKDSPLREPRRFINQTLMFAQALIDGSRIPLFDRAEILSLRPLEPSETQAPGAAEYEVKLITPFIDVISPEQLYAIYKEALRGAGRMSKNPFTAQNRQKEYQHFNTKVVIPIAQQASRGMSTQAVLRTAHAQDIPFIHRAGAMFQLGWGSKAIQIDRSSMSGDAAMASVISNSKRLTAKILTDAGLPAAKHISTNTLKNAREAAKNIGWPLVVKPADAERGEGVHINVSNDGELEAAFKHALKVSPGNQVLIEEQVNGTCHRIFISNGELLYAVKRCAKSVIGDGTSTVRALVETANQKTLSTPPWRREPLCQLDDEALQQIQSAGHSLESVPAKDELIHLREIESTLAGGHDIEVSHQIHPENLRIALYAAKIAGLHNAGIDIISQDITKPWMENGAIINEVNYAPLLGGGEISRSYLPTYLSRVIENDGRIPIDIFMGGDDAMAQAKVHQQTLLKKGLKTYLSSHSETLDYDLNQRPYPFTSLARRTKALLLDDTVDALVLVVQNADILKMGLPVDKATYHSTAKAEAFPRSNEVHTLLHSLQGV